MELDVIQAQKWNSNRVIVFQSVIVQLIQLVTGTNNICAQTDFGIDCWNHGTFEKLVNNTYTIVRGYPGRAHRIQSGLCANIFGASDELDALQDN